MAPPKKMELCPMAKVVVRTKRHSWRRFEKHFGRLPYGFDSTSSSSGNFSMSGFGGT